jgi:large subunit ribosomal protein L23
MDIIIKPLLTEKMTAITDKLNQVGFIVNDDANKLAIKKAVEEKYKVKVSSVSTIRYQGKMKSKYTKTGLLQGRKPSYKKAIVKLAEGDTIDFFSNI